LDAHSIVGLCLVAGAALLLFLTSAAQSARHPFSRHRPHPSVVGDGLAERGAPWLALEVGRLTWLLLGLGALEAVVVHRAGTATRPIATAAVLYLLAAALVDGVPRLIAGADPDRWRVPTTGIFTLERWLFWSPALLLDAAARGLVAIVPGLRPHVQPVDEEDIARLVEREESEGGIEPEERAMIRAVFELHETTAREIMAPRIDMAALDANASLQDVSALIAERGFSRIPIYESTIDNVVGIVYAKDVLAALARNEQTSVRALARTPLYVPESKPLDELLSEMRAQRLQIAIVVDEYGGTAGLLTIEDLVEEIVGEIQDEYDVGEPPVVRAEDGSVLIDARENVYVLDEQFDVAIEPEDFDTVGGLVIHALGRIPIVGDRVEAYGLEFQVVSAAGRRLRRVRVSRLAPAPVDETPAEVARNGG
jgi:CBS domain containing-hemolysin-like protein